MSTLTFEVPEEIHSQIGEVARQDGVTVDQLLRKLVSDFTVARHDYEKLRALQAQASQENPGAWERMLSKLPDCPPLPGDELTPDLKEWAEARRRSK